MTDSIKLEAPRHGLSLQFVTADSMHVDWSDLYQNGDEYDVVLPRPTYGDVEERAPDLLNDWQEARCHAEGLPLSEFEQFDRDAPLSDEHADAFGETDAYHEWADSFQPVMNYAWPVSLAYDGPSAEEAAELINRNAPACTLIAFNSRHSPFRESMDDAPDYAIALTGGGMDLSDQLAVAYLCCGCVPPERLLSGLDSFRGCNRSGSLTAAADLLREAYSSAADYFRNRADRLDQVAGRLALLDGARVTATLSLELIDDESGKPLAAGQLASIADIVEETIRHRLMGEGFLDYPATVDRYTITTAFSGGEAR